jgi:hypothetical protein
LFDLFWIFTTENVFSFPEERLQNINGGALANPQLNLERLKSHQFIQGDFHFFCTSLPSLAPSFFIFIVETPELEFLKSLWGLGTE